jgi:hypothetical protein
MKTGCVGFTGSRTLRHASRQDATLTADWSGLVGPVVAAVAGSGRGIAVGCAPGADALVRAAAPGARGCSASDYGSGRWASAARSQALVRAVLASGAGAGLVGFVAGPCPGGIKPSHRWRSGETPSGSWSTLALGVGLGLPVVVFACGWEWSPPAWPGTWARAGSGVWAAGWRFEATQMALF